ncbi:MAG: adenylate/guanylate cyclase domain-containing protein, partial [Verrucomicrobiota bacterium]
MHLAVVNLENPALRVKVDLSPDREVRIGRRPESFPGEPVDTLQLTWKDRLVSRNHCSATVEGDVVKLKRLPALTGRKKPNALYTHAAPEYREQLDEPIPLKPGDLVVIGQSGQTAIALLDQPEDLDDILDRSSSISTIDASTLVEKTAARQSYDEVSQLDEYSLRLQLRLLQQELPEQVLAGWTDEYDLFSRASVFLENSLPNQKGVTAVFVALSQTPQGIGYELLNPDPLAAADFRPSRTLLNQVDLESPDPDDCYIWTSQENQQTFSAESLGDQIDWVATIPIASLAQSAPIYRDANGRPIYLYVETRQATETAAAAFLPFLRLITSLVASLLSARADQKLQDQLAAYFSPGLREILKVTDQSVLEPAMVDCTVMFTDRRGHSRALEQAKSDLDILDRLNENQEIVGLITEEVFNNQGVITDFAGDGALALWGWPALEDHAKSHALEAIEAAESITARLADRVVYEEEMERRMGAVRIGISSGRIAVGKTGPVQQWHISVFGGVANLGARLERIAKEF